MTHQEKIFKQLRRHNLTRIQKRKVRAHVLRDMKHFREEIREDEELLRELEK